MKRDKLFRELQSAEARLKVGERSGQDLTEEHETLKKNYQVLAEAHVKELAQSAELSAELLVLAQAQDALRRQLEEQQQSVNTTTQGLHGEMDRVRALISRLSHNRVKVRQCVNSSALPFRYSQFKLEWTKDKDFLAHNLVFGAFGTLVP